MALRLYRVMSSAAAVWLAAAMCGPAVAQRVGFELNGRGRLGQRFTAERPFVSLRVSVPSWLDSEGGLTLALWESPARRRLLAKRVVSNVRDNELVELKAARALAAGAYYWDVSDRTGVTKVGLYIEPQAPTGPDCAYIDGVADPARRFVFELSGDPPPLAGEQRVLAALRSARTVQDRADACRQLAVVGTAASVAALSALLPDPALSHMARLALEAIPGDRASAALRGALGTLKGRLLVGVANSIGARRDEAAVPHLGRLLGSADPEVAAAAAAALGRIGTLAAAGVLSAARVAPAARRALDEARLACAQALAGPGHAARAASMFDALSRGAGPNEVGSAALRGAMMARGAAGLPLVLRSIRGADWQVAQALYVVQRGLPGAAATQALVAELPRLPAPRRLLLISALAGRGDQRAVPALQAAARSGDLEARAAAIRGVAKLGGAASVSTLVTLVGDPVSEVSRAAQEALASLLPSAVTSAAAGLVASPSPDARVCGIELIQRRRLAGFGSRLVVLSQAPEQGVRRAALRALADMGELAEARDLLRGLGGSTAPLDLDAISDALGAIASRVGGGALAADLAALAARVGPPVRASLVRVLAAVGGADALESVRRALSDADASVRSAALDGVCGWTTVDAAPILLGMARSAGEPTARLRCVQAVLRLAALSSTPAPQRLALCADVAPLVVRPDEGRMLLGALAGIPLPRAIGLANPWLDREDTRAEAAAAIIGAAGGLSPESADAGVLAALDRVAGASVPAEVKERARALRARLSGKL